MLENLFRNMTPVVKNLLIINVLVFLVVTVASMRGINLPEYLSLHHFTSDRFQPFQYVSSMFLHVDLFHLFANMLGLVSFGVALERYIGAKRFLTLYFISGLAGSFFYHGFHMAEIWYMGEDMFTKAIDMVYSGDMVKFNFSPSLINDANEPKLGSILFSRALGASGAVFGIFAGVFRFFPNTEVMLLFPPIPLKIKVLFSILMIGSVVLSIFPFMMQGIAHMAHFGGGAAGLALVEIWQRDKTKFY